MIYALRDENGVVVDSGSLEECQQTLLYFEQNKTDVSLWIIGSLYGNKPPYSEDETTIEN